ncbi:corticotropin-releasing factor receptor 2-like [Amphiura filiformis]|uniref:corticotropin-releasing factor receptor 2-like n=1 Tax=Amphiura filiformis TaxID=82378 RepID=UPI003B228BDC
MAPSILTKTFLAVVSLWSLVIMETSAIEAGLVTSPEPSGDILVSKDPTWTSTMSTEDNAGITTMLAKISAPVYLCCTGVSLISCLIAFTVYFIVRKYKNINSQTRHWINWNFMFSFILRDVTVLTTMIISMTGAENITTTVPWKVFVVYTVIPNLFWMFVEGLHLYWVAFHTWDRFQSWLKLTMFTIGWILPACLTSIWSLQQYAMQGDFDFEEIPAWICIRAPFYLVLLLNLIMMTRIINTIAIKWRTIKCQTEKNKAIIIRKLAKSTLLISILLGVPQIIPVIILNVVEDASLVSVIVQFINSIWSGLQGFLVAFLYVLLNDEVMVPTKRRLSSLTSSLPTHV